jgi:hypothetical protein
MQVLYCFIWGTWVSADEWWQVSNIIKVWREVLLSKFNLLIARYLSDLIPQTSDYDKKMSSHQRTRWASYVINYPVTVTQGPSWELKCISLAAFQCVSSMLSCRLKEHVCEHACILHISMQSSFCAVHFRSLRTVTPHSPWGMCKMLLCR